jgi:NTE family protein
MHFPRLFAALVCALLFSGCQFNPFKAEPLPPPPAEPKIGLALGGGAARGFAHVGVIKALEAQGIRPDFIAGTSAGSVVGAIYAAGFSPFDVQRLAMDLDESQITDWGLPARGVLKGEALETFINRVLRNRTLEKLEIPLGVVAADLASGAMVVFRSGNAGQAVRASSAVPDVFRPVEISGREYVDGGLVSPVPVRPVRKMGANFVIAVDISAKPTYNKTESSTQVLLQTFAIMGQSIASRDLPEAQVVIRPNLKDVAATDFKGRNRAILEGEIAVAQVLTSLKEKLRAAGWRGGDRVAGAKQPG